MALTDSLGVKTDTFGARRCFVSLERQVIYDNANDDELGEPRCSIRLKVVDKIVANSRRSTIMMSE